MRLLPVLALSAVLASAAGPPARAIDVEVLAAPSAGSSAAPDNGAVETGSIGEPPGTSEADPADAAPAETPLGPADTTPAQSTPTPATPAGVEPAESTPVEAAAETLASPLGRSIKKLLEAEAAAAAEAAAQAPPLAEGVRPPPKTAEQRDAEAIQAFYTLRNGEPAWVGTSGLTPVARAAVGEIGRAGDWGLDPKAFELPDIATREDAGTAAVPEDQLAAAELMLARAFLKFHLHARGGVIYDAPKELSSYLDRRPQLRDRRVFLEEMSKSEDGAAYVRGLHPKHAEFERLRQAWLSARGGKAGKGRVSADQLLANMQQWRWMPEDLGDFHVVLNVPEYMIRIYKSGEVVFNERATAGLVNKQTPIFSDEIERVTFKSKWRVPDSIKVKEVWPSLLKGGGMMRQHGLVMMKGEEQVDWTRIDWTKADMNDYTLWQPPGPKNQLGLVKFSFPNKHRVYMHDTPDKHMFAWSRRAVSHGCMRIRNPLQMATIILGNDKGWDRAKVDDLARNGPEHNIVELEKKVPVHMMYLTVRIDEAGKVQTFPDIYGHEKRVRQALAGDWTKIAKGGDHLAPLDQTRAPRVAVASRKTRALREPRTLTELMFGGN